MDFTVLEETRNGENLILSYWPILQTNLTLRLEM